MTCKILVIDDEASITFVVKATLEDRYDVATTTSALSAFKYLSDHRVDLILLDIKMPHINGIEALEKIKKQYPEIIVIMMTAYASSNNMEKAMLLGAYGFISKPFEIDDLRDTVDKAISEKVVT
jgi:DNA-binding NtrC family response regulator